MNAIAKEALSLLFWSMLAAGTVGPGTVVTCARAGAEFQLQLIWPLIFASLLAYTLLEGTVRLTITSEKSLGQCLQLKYKRGRLFWRVSIICWLVAGSVFIGNTLFNCNSWAGGMSAIYSLPGAENTVGLRVGCCIGYGVIVFAMLAVDKVDSLGVGLGLIMVGMVILFMIVAIKLGVDGVQFGKGLLPISMPSGSANIVLSLVGTTAIGFNIFLGGGMAVGKTLGGAQRGIAFSTFMALLVSVLILIVGSGTYYPGKDFTIASLASIVEQKSGKVGVWVFGIGFIAAAISSMLTATLGAAMTADSVFTITADTEDNQGCSYNVKNSETQQSLTGSSVELKEIDDATDRKFPKKYYNGMMFIMVLVAVIVISADAPTVKVILIAQVFNGCLLPFFSICLLICLNDPQFMRDRPQRGWANCFLLFVVLVTIFLTSNTIMQNIFGWIVSNGHTSEATFETVKFSLAGVCSVVLMTCLCLFTDLGRNIRNSFRPTEK